jgi:ubiquitin thioesterase protein OTUB1
LLVLIGTAIAFTYFEALLHMGDVNKLGEEESRLNSLGDLLEHIGYSRDIWIDFAEEAFELMHKLANSLRTMDGQAESILLRTFNDMNESMAIITYVKVSLLHLYLSEALTPLSAPSQCLGADARR